MTRDLIREAVNKPASVTEVLIGRGVLTEAGALYRRPFGPGNAWLIADENTWAAAGEATLHSLNAAGIETRTHVLSASPRP
jgi:glycerol-1-phosphate dehydrogenase [NAD(P)+]